jgi:hypothetical protein
VTDPEAEEAWCDSCREEVIQYLAQQHVSHRKVGEWPAWHIAPYASVWAIESKKKPGWVGWWAICGDLPTDYVTACEPVHPREALRAFSARWQDVAAYLERGATHPTITIGQPDEGPELAPLLASRAEVLLEWADDDDLWEEE